MLLLLLRHNRYALGCIVGDRTPDGEALQQHDTPLAHSDDGEWFGERVVPTEGRIVAMYGVRRWERPREIEGLAVEVQSAEWELAQQLGVGLMEFERAVWIPQAYLDPFDLDHCVDVVYGIQE